METVTVAELGRRPGATLSSAKPSIVTNNGKPQNLIVNVDGMEIDEVVDMARAMQARAALSAMRRISAERGTDGMTMDEVDAEVDAVRDGE